MGKPKKLHVELEGFTLEKVEETVTETDDDKSKKYKYILDDGIHQKITITSSSEVKDLKPGQSGLVVNITSNQSQLPTE